MEHMQHRRVLLPHRTIGSDLLVVAPRRQAVHLLNETGAFIWERLDGSTTEETIAADLASTFDCVADRARDDLALYLRQLSEMGLLEGEGAAAAQAEAVERLPCSSDPCETIPLLPEIQERAFRDLMPLNATIELTLACNLRCVHCYNTDRSRPLNRHDSLTTAELISAVDQLREAGTMFLTLTGGEVFARRDFFEIMDHAAQAGMTVNILTNGSMIDRKIAERLSGYRNLWGVSISLYGATAGVHDAVTRVEGSFRRIMEGISFLRDCDVPVSLKFIIMRGNVREASEMIALGERMALPYAVDPLITPRNDASPDTVRERITTEEVTALYRGPLRRLLPPVGAVEDGQSAFLCNCARAMCAISATGDIHPCIAVPMKAGNIREQSFREIWESSPTFQWIRGLRPEDFRKCWTCIHKEYCRRDRGNAYTLRGDYTGVDEWVCRESDAIRAIVLGEEGGADVAHARGG